MKIKINPDVFLNMLVEAEQVLKDRLLFEKQVEITEYNNALFVRLGLSKKATIENHEKLIEPFSSNSYWTDAKIYALEKKIQALLFAIKRSAMEFKELDDIVVDSDYFAYLNKIMSSKEKKYEF